MNFFPDSSNSDLLNYFDFKPFCPRLKLKNFVFYLLYLILVIVSE